MKGTLHPNYGPLIVALMDQAWKIHGRFTPDNHALVVDFVRHHVDEVKARQRSANDSQPELVTPPANVRPFRAIDAMESEDGFR